MPLRLIVKGSGYHQTPSGTGGSEFVADEEGPEADKIWYKVPDDRGLLAKLFGIGEDVDRVLPAYLSREERDSLNDIVEIKPEEAVERAAYYLMLIGRE